VALVEDVEATVAGADVVVTAEDVDAVVTVDAELRVEDVPMLDLPSALTMRLPSPRCLDRRLSRRKNQINVSLDRRNRVSRLALPILSFL
jgi:hypothetical protein